MEFIKMMDALNALDITWNLPACCDPGQSSYSLLRVQMRADISFSQDGVTVSSPEHDPKCQALLEKARAENIDLVLFPEYCVSYSLLENIAKNTPLWPKERKLWVLPCQGVSVDAFDSFLKRCASLPNVFLLDSAWTHCGINKKRFVTALFYCFRIHRGEQALLCLVPQLKTHHMGDRDCLCEAPGMTAGSVIFSLNDRLITLLCADALNNDITWRELQSQGLTQGPVILHPQLNAHPKDSVFSRLRRELCDHGGNGTYITCNWAKGTTLSQQGTVEKPSEAIQVSWSCVYRKHADDVFAQWQQKTTLREANGKCGLFGVMMRSQRIEVWFSPYYEQALVLHVPNLAFHGYGNTQLPDIHAGAQLFYAVQSGRWIEQVQAEETLQQRIYAVCPPEHDLVRYSESIKKPYRFPLDTSEPNTPDRFFALALAEFHNAVLEIDRDENLVAWTRLLDDAELETAVEAFARLWSLIHILEPENAAALPPQCAPLKEEHRFCYRPRQGARPGINFRSQSAELTVAIASEAVNAKRHMKFLKHTECLDDDDLLRRFIRVFYYDPVTRELNCEPQFSTDITRGEGVIMEGDITDGGTEPNREDRSPHWP